VNRRKSRIEMHLESLHEQTVWVQDLVRGFHFEKASASILKTVTSSRRINCAPAPP